MRWYEVQIEKDDNGTWLLTLPAFPELASYGISRTKAFTNLRKGLQVTMASRMGEWAPLPEAQSGPTGQTPFVEVPPLTLIKSTLYSLMKKQNVSVPVLAARLGTAEDRVQRLLRIEHNSQLDLLDDALRALGAALVIDVIER